MRGHRPIADEEPLRDLAVGKTVDNVADDLALAITELLVEDCFHLSVRNEVGDLGPVGFVLSPDEGAKLVGPLLLEKIDIVELPCMFYSHGDEGVFVFGGEDLSAGRAGEPELESLMLFGHAGALSLILDGVDGSRIAKRQCCKDEINSLFLDGKFSTVANKPGTCMD